MKTIIENSTNCSKYLFADDFHGQSCWVCCRKGKDKLVQTMEKINKDKAVQNNINMCFHIINLMKRCKISLI